MRRGEYKDLLSFSKKKNVFLGNIKSFHSAKFRFTFTHVYIHAPLNLKIKPTIICFRFTTPYYIYKHI